MFTLKKSLIVGVAALVVIVGGVVAVGAQGRDGDGRGGRGIGGELLQEYTGLTGPEIREALSDGETTIADLIEANGEGVDDFIAESVAVAEARITERVTTPFDPSQRPGRGPRGFGDGPRGMMGNLVREYTGLTGPEIREALSDSETTLADLIEANEQSVDDFVAESIAPVQARLDAAVEVGRITEEEAAERLGEFEARLTEMLETPFDPSERRGRGGFGGGPRGGFGAPDAEVTPEATAEADA